MRPDKGGAAGSLDNADPFPETPAASGASRVLLSLDDWCLGILAQRLRGAHCQLRLWNGNTVLLSEFTPCGTVIIKDRAVLWRLLWQPELAFGEGYASGRIEVFGNLCRTIESVNVALRTNAPHGGWAAAGRRARAISQAAARQNVRRHYDLGNEFYKLWLDAAMVYTCAYFEQPQVSLEEAQQAKLDYVCRKLALRPGDRVIEAGCGWGALALHMAKAYGARVTAYNISREQIRHARDEAARQGVADQVTFVDGDFRSISGTCDAFVSVGMLEHVGLKEYRSLGAAVDRVLDADTGRGLIHFIGRNHPKPFDAWIQRYIFPGAYAPALSEVTADVLEPWDLSVVDVENLRPHYAATLRHWRLRFEQTAGRAAQMFDDQFVRMWRLYLASAEAAFTTGDLQLFQITFCRAADNSRQWTRSHLYPDANLREGADGHP